jgi:ubiquinone/menaquinone biosynthesis C-methylase UbiE
MTPGKDREPTEDRIIAEDFYRKLLLREVGSSTDWLDLGCGWRLLREWLPNGEADGIKLAKRAHRLVGIDAVPEDLSRNPYVHEKLVGDILNLPLSDASFDLVTAQMVVEHLARPEDLLYEVKRVLRPGGKFIILTPNYLNYQIFVASLVPDNLKKRIVYYLERRPERDVFKTYYRMNTRNCICKMARQIGFAVEAIHMLHPDFEFRRIAPLYWVEKVLYRILNTGVFSTFRPDILAVLLRPSETAFAAQERS